MHIFLHLALILGVLFPTHTNGNWVEIPRRAQRFCPAQDFFWYFNWHRIHLAWNKDNAEQCQSDCRTGAPRKEQEKVVFVYYSPTTKMCRCFVLNIATPDRANVHCDGYDTKVQNGEGAFFAPPLMFATYVSTKVVWAGSWGDDVRITVTRPELATSFLSQGSLLYDMYRNKRIYNFEPPNIETTHALNHNLRNTRTGSCGGGCNDQQNDYYVNTRAIKTRSVLSSSYIGFDFLKDPADEPQAREAIFNHFIKPSLLQILDMGQLKIGTLPHTGCRKCKEDEMYCDMWCFGPNAQDQGQAAARKCCLWGTRKYTQWQVDWLEDTYRLPSRIKLGLLDVSNMEEVINVDISTETVNGQMHPIQEAASACDHLGFANIGVSIALALVGSFFPFTSFLVSIASIGISVGCNLAEPNPRDESGLTFCEFCQKEFFTNAENGTSFIDNPDTYLHGIRFQHQCEAQCFHPNDWFLNATADDFLHNMDEGCESFASFPVSALFEKLAQANDEGLQLANDTYTSCIRAKLAKDMQPTEAPSLDLSETQPDEEDKEELDDFSTASFLFGGLAGFSFCAVAFLGFVLRHRFRASRNASRQVASPSI